MKILFVIPYFYPKTGGLENYALNMALQLAKKGHEIHIFTTAHDKTLQRYEQYLGLTIYRSPILITLSNTPVHFQWYWELKKYIKLEHFDIVNPHTPVPFISDIATRVAHDLGIPVMLIYHNDLVKNNWLDWIIRGYYWLLGSRTVRLADVIITTSLSYAQESPYLHPYVNKIHVIAPGVNEKIFSNINESLLKKINRQDRYSVLFVSQMDKTHSHRGLDVLIKSLVPIKDKVHLLAVGKGNYLEHYRQLAQNYGLEANFPGYVSDEDLPTYYQAADCVCLPSTNRSEGYGMVLLEGGYMGKPLIGSCIGGIPNLIEEGKTGLLVQPGDEQSLRQAIESLLNNPPLSKKMGETARKKFMQQTWTTQALMFEQLASKLIIGLGKDTSTVTISWNRL